MKLVKTHEPKGKITKAELEHFLREFVAMGVRCAEVDSYQTNYKTQESLRNTFYQKAQKLNLPIKIMTRGNKAYLINTTVKEAQ
jgi:translation initiation factor 2 beta subunit (eIF-2beta)/eIF-5